MTSTNGEYSGSGEVPDDVVRVLRGRPDDVELAALVAGIVASRAVDLEEVDDGTRSSVWRDPAHRMGIARPGRGSWRWSSHRV